jgi:hypothetical protein
MALSVSSGPAGTVVRVSGNAGPGCVVGENWWGFEFQRYGETSVGPVTEMTTPVAADGKWSVLFTVPSYLGGSATGGLGAPTTPGRYQLAAPTCTTNNWAMAAFHVTTGAPAGAPGTYVGIAATRDGRGYWLVQSGGGVDAFGDATSYGSLPTGKTAHATPVAGIARTSDGRGYWLATANGSVYSFGDAHFYGSLPAGHIVPPAPVTGIAAVPGGGGYWLATANGRVYTFGDARADGQPDNYDAPYDAIAARPAGGYVITASNDAAVYELPGGSRSGGKLGTPLSASLVGTAVTPSGNGTWQAGMDGGVVTSGDARFYGSLPGERLAPRALVTGIAAAPDGRGYWLVDASGRVYSFGDAHAFGPAVH